MNEKMRRICEVMQGITYLEWTKLRAMIDRSFDSEAAKATNRLKIAATDELEKTYKLLF